MTHTAADLHRRFPVGTIIQLEPLPGAVVYALVTGHSYDGLDVIEATDDGLEPGEVEAFMVGPEQVKPLDVAPAARACVADGPEWRDMLALMTERRARRLQAPEGMA